MGLFDKIKEAASILVERANTSSAKGGIASKKFDIPMEQREPELAEFYNLFVESVNSRSEAEAEELGIKAITAFINAYTPKLLFLDDPVKLKIWDYTKSQGVFDEETAALNGNKNILLHFIYALRVVGNVDDFEEKVMYAWNQLWDEGEGEHFYKASFYSHDLFDMNFKKFKQCLKYLPDNTCLVEAPVSKSSCEHGDCVVCNDDFCEKLFCTCKESASCSKKRSYDLGNLWDERLLPILKVFAKADDEDDYTNQQQAYRTVAEMILSTFAPALNSRSIANLLINHISFRGVASSPIVRYLVNAQKRNFVFDLEKSEAYLAVINALNKDGHRFDVDSAEWLYNDSLYKSKRLNYLLNAFITFSDKKYIRAHLLDDSVVDITRFYNEDGTIKDAGGAGIEGDTIYNIVEEWCSENENEALFAEEKRQREEKEREEKERARREEMCIRCKHRFSCSAVGKVAVCPKFEPYSYH